MKTATALLFAASILSLPCHAQQETVKPAVPATMPAPAAVASPTGKPETKPAGKPDAKPATSEAVPSGEKPVRLLSIGNSFSRNATTFLPQLAKAGGHELDHTAVVVGGASFELHSKKALDHEKDPKQGLYTNKRSLKDELLEKPWDFITIQQASIKSHDIKTFRPFAADLYGYIKKYAPKSELLMHQTWPYRSDDGRFRTATPKEGTPATNFEMYQMLTNAYKTIAAELGIRRLPVGDAFYLADSDPQWGYKGDINFDSSKYTAPALPDQTHSLHAGFKWSTEKGQKKLGMDGHHASTAGQYLGACVWYEALFNDSVVDNTFVPGGMDPKWARFLRETAHRAVTDQPGLIATIASRPVPAPRVIQPPSKEMLDLSLEAPEINTNPGPQYADSARWGSMIIGMDRTPKGRIWGCWVGNGDNPNGFFLLASSDDGGTTWSKPRVVIDPTDPKKPEGIPQRRALVGNVWTDPSGKLWVFFDQSLGFFDGRGGDWYITCENPDDEKPVWSKPVRFADGCTLNKPTVLKNDEWLLPVSIWDRSQIGPAILKEAHRDLDKIRGANVYASKDQGRTWTRRGGVAFPNPQFDEHMIVELKDGRLWMLARTAKDLSESFSTDGGATWSPPKPSAIQNVSSRFFIRRLASGKLLLVKNGPIDQRLPKRSHMTAFLSDDDGKTWQGGLLLDERADVSYPDGFQSPDGVIHVLYDWNRHTDAEILVAKFREEDVLAKTFQSAGAKAQIRVNKATGPKPGKAKDEEDEDPEATEGASAMPAAGASKKEEVKKPAVKKEPAAKPATAPVKTEAKPDTKPAEAKLEVKKAA